MPGWLLEGANDMPAWVLALGIAVNAVIAFVAKSQFYLAAKNWRRISCMKLNLTRSMFQSSCTEQLIRPTSDL